MSNLRSTNRPSTNALLALFKHRTGCQKPPESKIYTCDSPSPVRAIAEFEDMGGVLIAYPGTLAQPPSMSSQSGAVYPNTQAQKPPTGPRSFGIPNELIIRMQQADSCKPVHIFIFCADLAEKTHIVASLAATAASMNLTFKEELIHLIPWDTDTYWTRDYGPWWIHNKVTDYYGIAKHVYTTLGGGEVGLVEGAETVDPLEGLGIFRPNDDYAAVCFSDYLNNPIRKWNGATWNSKKNTPQINVHDWFFTGLLDVGGNYMVNGEGIIVSSYLVATQNELPVLDETRTTDPCAATIARRMAYITEQLNRFMGIHKYHVLSDPTGTYIGHIDCWGKFLAKDKILIANSQDPEVDAAFDHIADSFKQEGFQVYRVMCQDIYVPLVNPPATTAAYTNSLILNDHVYVPIAGPPYHEDDERALQVYREALPAYTVIGIPGKPENPWLGTDALHCRTRAVPRQVVDNWLQSQMLK